LHESVAASAKGRRPDFNVIVVGWDAVQRDHFWQCYRGELDGCREGLPAIQALSQGRIFGSFTTSGATMTKPGWAQILSGYNAEVMGIYGNWRYRPLPAGYSVMEKLEKHFGPENIVTLFVAGENGNVSGLCPGEMGEVKGQPWCLTKRSLDCFETGLHTSERVGQRALELLEKHRHDRFFAFFYFAEPDHAGHAFGENSIQYSQAIVDDDRWLGRIMAKLRALGIYRQTLIYVITDHGFDEGQRTHINAPYGFMATKDWQVTRSGDRRDLAPTILKRYGISLEGGNGIPPVDGRPLDEPLLCIYPQ